MANATKKAKSHVLRTTQAAVLAVSGMPQSAIAEQLGISQRTVSRAIDLASPALDSAAQTVGDWRAKLKQSAIGAVQRAVDDVDAVQPAGTLALKVLVGLGELQGEASVNVNTFVGEIPQGMRHMVRLARPDPDHD